MIGEVGQVMDGTLPLTWILVLHWRGIEHTRACLGSLRTLTYGNYKVLLVDNGSDNLDGETLKEEFPEIFLLRLESNRGFSGGCNAGIEYCLDNEAEFIWLLNNDATVDKDTLGALVEAAVNDTAAGAVSACIVERNPQTGEVLSRLGRGVLDLVNAKAHLKAPLHDDITKCDWISGSNMLLKAEALKQSGLLDDDYFLYFEDVEICVRLKQNGWHCLLVPGASIEHADGASTAGEFISWRYYYYARNRLFFFSRYPGLFTRNYCLLRIYLHLFRHSITLPFRDENARKKLDSEKKALHDFLKGVKGKVDFN